MIIKNIGINHVIEYANNPRNNDEAAEAVASSIREYGFKVPIIVDKENVIVAGHTRLKAARLLGLESVPVIVADDLTDAQIKAFRLADNKTAELAEWDFEKLETELSELAEMGVDMECFGFDEFEAPAPEIIEDDVPEVDEESDPITKHGDLWRLGRHVLMCGDSTDKNAVRRLMNGEKADLLQTDPPYNVALGHHDTTDEARQRHRRTDGLLVMNDSMGENEFYNFLLKFYQNAKENMKKGASFYVWHADNEGLNFRMALRDAGFILRQTLIWNKSSITLGRQDYQWKHEPCLYGWNDGASHKWYSDRCQSTVMDFNKPSRSEEHPTMKPVELIAYQIGNSTKKNDVVLDLFGGSGTTLIACEQTGRVCYTAELDPKYCDVIIKRWENLTGEKAVKIN